MRARPVDRHVAAGRSRVLAVALATVGAVAAVSPVLMGAPLRAEERVLRLDPAKTRIEFYLGSTLHDVEGAFALQSGEVRFDPGTGAARGEITVDLRVAKTGNGSRDNTMQREVLETPRFPLAVLRAERLVGQLPSAGRAEVKLAGTLDFHGAPHAITLPATVEVSGSRLSARAELAIPFLEWGLHDPSILFLRVERIVKVIVSTEGELGNGE